MESFASATSSPLPVHSWDYRVRRTLNWFVLGLTYATFYMGRYNMNKAKPILGDKDHFLWSKAESGFWLGTIPFWIYAASVLVNGPLADRFGGKRAILFGGVGVIFSNLLLGFLCTLDLHAESHVIQYFGLATVINCYFQSFGALSVVKVNAPWFHVKERGLFGGIFGCMIQSGYMLALGVGGVIVGNLPLQYVFFIPAGLLTLIWVWNWQVVRETPGQAGFQDFDTGDAGSGDEEPVSIAYIARKVFTNPVLLVIAAAEICTGFARMGLLFYFTDYFRDVHKIHHEEGAAFWSNWISIPVGGMIGGIIAGRVSDRFFKSRRPPVAFIAYVLLAATLVYMVSFLAGFAPAGVAKDGYATLPDLPNSAHLALMAAVIFGAMNFSINAIHGLLSGTSAADFGGKKAAASATGLLDGCQYVGAGFAMTSVGMVIDTYGYKAWPIPMLVAALTGAALMATVWNVTPKRKIKTLVGPSSLPRRATRAGQRKVLDQVLAQAKAQGERGVVAFDLDSTLLDNRPRQAQILREWAEKRGGPPEVARCQPAHLDGWDLRIAMVNAGLAQAEAEKLFPEAKAFWRERFFTSPYCVVDDTIPGAAAYLEALRATGVKIAYVTGRHELMRAGTVDCFKKHGFPAPDEKTVQLLMKPTLEEDDDQFKREAYERLKTLGTVIAAFDNEPVHVNGYKSVFAEALVVHLDTDHSMRPVEVKTEIPSVLDFVL
jgi:OPA family glycerol-3-phosphate transporter-like MFS transporter